MPAVRSPVLAGTWYPAEPALLRAQVASYLAGADEQHRPHGKPRIAVVPHAGYEYSGPTAGKFYGLLAGQVYAAVFILAPSHRTRLARAVLPGVRAFATPLGEVPVAREIVTALADLPCFDIDDRAHAHEHAVEIQLPLLQCALPSGTPIVPILVPHLDGDTRRCCAAALNRWRDERHLFLVSSDFTHYGADYGYLPFTQDVPTRLEQLDAGAILKILAHDGDGLVAYGTATGITMCGLDACALALTGAAPVGYEASLLDYARSADPQGDYSRSVSYASLVLCAGVEGPVLTPDDRATLLSLARAALVAAVRGDAPPPLPEPLGARLQDRRGVFVTLHAPSGDLRGCIGILEARSSLAAAVVDYTRAAALEDPRFRRVSPAEVDGLTIEISALSPLRRVDGPHQVEVGRHGILLSKGGRRAVFLPQVAAEQGWDLPTTLDHLARKAGLAAGDWRSETELHIFEADVMSEELA